MSDLDPSLLQDFLTESGELIEQLDGDLVKLEAADPDEQADLLNACFRALHTIKGAASFLGLAEVIRFAHVAEDALNRLRKGEVAVSTEVMDALLQSADIVRAQIDDISAGSAITEAPDDLVAQLQAIIDGKAVTDAAAAPATGDTPVAQSDEASEAPAVDPDRPPGKPLGLPAQKVDLVDFMVTDLQDATPQLAIVADQLLNDATRSDAASNLAEIAENLEKTADFFELDDLTRVIRLLVEVAEDLGAMPGELAPEVAVRVKSVQLLVDRQAEWLAKDYALAWSLDTFEERFRGLSQGVALSDDVAGKHGGDPEAILVLDGIVADAPAAAPASEPVAQPEPTAESAPTPTDQAEPAAPAEPKAATKPEAKASPAAPAGKAAAPEQTIRVEVSRLESLLNLVGQLVLSKNRLMGLSRQIRETQENAEDGEAFVDAASELDRLTGELQVGVMRTRMQPLAKLFDRYPRVIRDIARATDKKIDLVIEGKDTEVDKSVLEALADPLVHILRNSADHGVEPTEVRKQADKPETGVIRLTAEHQGSHVRVAISDDGKGLNREILGNKAVERGLVTAEKLATLSDEEVFRFIFEAGFSTAKQVSDLSGRGVGMDVVKTNIQKINGDVHIQSTLGKGTTMEIMIPLTVAIMPAMVVGVGGPLYCIPLQSIVEIVSPEEDQLYTVRGQQVMRIRDDVLPLIDLHDHLPVPAAELDGATDRGGEMQSNRFAVVVAVGGQRVGLRVDRLVGQQEIVIKPLDDTYTQGGPFSGATIQEDGRVCLILDVVTLIKASAASSTAVVIPQAVDATTQTPAQATPA
ncbi:MAG: chemotaxis protein CheA [Planctomycetota bacterium]